MALPRLEQNTSEQTGVGDFHAFMVKFIAPEQIPTKDLRNGRCYTRLVMVEGLGRLLAFGHKQKLRTPSTSTVPESSLNLAVFSGAVESGSETQHSSDDRHRRQRAFASCGGGRSSMAITITEALRQDCSIATILSGFLNDSLIWLRTAIIFEAIFATAKCQLGSDSGHT